MQGVTFSYQSGKRGEKELRLFTAAKKRESVSMGRKKGTQKWRKRK